MEKMVNRRYTILSLKGDRGDSNIYIKVFIFEIKRSLKDD